MSALGRDHRSYDANAGGIVNGVANWSNYTALSDVQLGGYSLIDVGGLTTTGSTTIEADLTVSGSAIVSSDLTVTGPLNVFGAAGFGDVTLQGDLHVNGPVTLADTLYCSTIGPDLYLDNDLVVRNGGGTGFHQTFLRGSNTTQRMDIGGRNSGQFGIGIYKSDDTTYGIQLSTGTGAAQQSYLEGRLAVGADAVSASTYNASHLAVIGDTFISGAADVIGATGITGDLNIYNSDLIVNSNTLATALVRREMASVNTTDATTTILYESLNMSTNGIMRIDAVVVARINGTAGAANGATYTVKAMINRPSSGGASLLWSSVTEDHEWDAGLAVTVTEDNDIKINVTGLAATDIDWICYVDQIYYNDET